MSRINFQKQFLMIVILVCAALFVATSMIFFFGMMPTIASNLIDRTHNKNKVMCVGMMNLAGVMPFLMELWMSPAPNAINNAIEIIMQPKAVIIMYSMAAAGYAIEKSITGMVAALMQQRALARLKQIEMILEQMKSRWGDHVDGATQLDDYGFPENRE